MMLPSDMALVWDPVFKKHVEEYAKDEALFLRDVCFFGLIEFFFDEFLDAEVSPTIFSISESPRMS